MIEMNILWTPWRLNYIRKSRDTRDNCVFCEMVNGIRNDLIVYRGKKVFIVLNAFPYNIGHVMVVPNRHIPSLELLNDEEANELMNLIKLTLSIVREEYKPDGFNIGVNEGKASGAGVEGHIHVHIVPRWIGDTNFLPIIGNTKTIPEDLETTKKRLLSAFSKRL